MTGRRARPEAGAARLAARPGATALHLTVQYATEGAAASASRARVRRWVRAALDALPAGRRVAAATLAVRFVDDDEGRALNRTFRGRDSATNVLTFSSDDVARGTVAADVVVCLPVVAREAAEQRKAMDAHLAHLVVHGTLHACGYDHEATRDAETMEALERRVLARFGIADPYREDVSREATDT